MKGLKSVYARPDQTLDFLVFLVSSFCYGSSHMMLEVLMCRPNWHMYSASAVFLEPVDEFLS